jgi:hypothetical protein
VKTKLWRTSVFIACLFVALQTPGQNLPSTPVTVTVTRADESIFNATFAGVPGGFDVGNNTYLGWCMDLFNTNNPTFGGGVHTALLLNVFATNLPAPFAGKPWDKIHYLLNHKHGGSGDIQAALWHFTDGFAPDPVSNPLAVLMVQDAEANGRGYVPGPSNVVCVALVWQGADTNFQHVVIEVAAGTTPGCCDRFTACGSLCVNGKSASVSIQGKCENGRLSGAFTLVDSARKLRVKSRAITSYTVLDADCRRATYDVDINGTPGTATVRVCDYSGSGEEDFVDIALSNGYGVAGEVSVRVDLLKCELRCRRCGGNHWSDRCGHGRKDDCDCKDNCDRKDHKHKHDNCDRKGHKHRHDDCDRKHDKDDGDCDKDRGHKGHKDDCDRDDQDHNHNKDDCDRDGDRDHKGHKDNCDGGKDRDRKDRKDDCDKGKDHKHGRDCDKGKK